MYEVALLVGSVRRGSINGQLAHALGLLAGDRFRLRNIVMDGLPMYNDDLWENPPEIVEQFKSSVRITDAVLLVTPEYDRSIPPLLKNAIDWGARPKGHNVWTGKPLAVAGASIGVIGTAVAQAHLKAIMLALDAAVMGQPEVYLAYKEDMFTEAGAIADPTLAALLTRFVDRFAAWIQRVGGCV